MGLCSSCSNLNCAEFSNGKKLRICKVFNVLLDVDAISCNMYRKDFIKDTEFLKLVQTLPFDTKKEFREDVTHQEEKPFSELNPGGHYL